MCIQGDRERLIAKFFEVFIRNYHKPSDEIVFIELIDSGIITKELIIELEPSEISFKYFRMKFRDYCESFGILKNNRRLVDFLLNENRKRILQRS